MSISTNQFYQTVNRTEQYKKKYSLILTVLVVLQLFFLAVFKSYSVGYDTSVYAKGFSQFADMGLGELFQHEWEIGYILSNRIISLIGLDFRFFLVMMNIFLYAILFKFLIEESKIPWLSAFLYIAFDYFAFSLSVYRQTIAIFITLISIKYIRKSNFLKFFITILIASLFHQSALIFLIVYPISQIKLTKGFYLISASIGALLLLFGNSLINFLLSLYDRNQTVNSGSGYNYFLMLLFITLFGIAIYYKFKSYVSKQDQNDINVYIQIMIIAVILQIFSFHMSIFVRVVYYFSFYLIVYIPNLLKFIPMGSRRKTIFLGIFTVGLVLFLYFLNIDINGITPYQFFWQ